MKLSAVLAATLLAAAAGRAEAACQIGIMASLPITMQGLRPTTTATVNGTEAPFLVDSGAFYSVITPGSARQFGLHLDPAPPGFYMRGIGGDATVSITTVQQFGIAGQSLRRVKFLVGGSEVGQDSGGVVGYNVLGIGDAEYDLARGVVRLIKPTGCTRADFPYWAPGTGSEVVTELGIGTRPNRIVATASINGTSIRVLFDTGAATSAISRAAAARAGIDVTGPGAVESGIARGFGKRVVREWTVPVAVFKIGTEEVHKTRINVIEELGGGVGAPDMLLGADFFLSHRVYVARDLHRLYFTYNGGNVFNLRAPVPVAAAADTTVTARDEPATAEDFARRGAAFSARHDYGRAIDDLTRAIALAPTEARYLSERAAAYAGNRQPFLAMADLDAALKLRPDDVPTLMRRAVARLGGRDRAGALADLMAVDAAASREADVRLALGELYSRLGDLPRAIAQFDLWMAVHRDDSKQAAALNARCWARALLGTDLELAEKDCAAAHRLEPGNLAILDSRGLVRLRRGDLAGAVADYDLVLAKQKMPWALYGRGVAKARMGRADAEADLAAARMAAPRLAVFARAHGIMAPGDAAPSAAAAPATLDDVPPATP